jgi:predicted enzyme related to lactoylglutathione lyase
MWTVGERPIGGVMPLPEEAKAAGAPPHWLANVHVEDVDATVAKAKELGGTLLHGPEDIPKVGRFALIQDPQGAVLSALKTSEAQPPVMEPGQGVFTWNELNTTDGAAAEEFYVSLFGLAPTKAEDMGPELGLYRMFESGSGASRGGISEMAKLKGTHPSWLYYVMVSDLDATVAKVAEHGGQVLNGPMEVPGGDRVAQCLDPQGAAFALHEAAKG